MWANTDFLFRGEKMANAQTITLNLKALGDFSDVTGDISQIQQMLNKIKVPANLKNNFDGIFEGLTKETQRYQKLLDSGFKKKSDITGLESSGTKINNLLKRLKVEMDKIKTSDLQKSFQVDPSKMQELTQKAKALQTNLQAIMSSGDMSKFKQQVADAAVEMQKVSKTKFTNTFAEAFNKGDIQGASEALRQLEANHKAFQDSAKEKTFQQALNEMKTALNGLGGNSELQNLVQQIHEVDLQMNNLDADELQAFMAAFGQGRSQVDNFTQGVRQLTAEQHRAAQAAQEHQQQIDQFRSQVMYFFSLTNVVQLFRQAVSNALETVKELDKTMTEAAVVTDFSVEDMWKKLPQYAKEAQKLGVSINGMYQATTLYYQQGLKTNASMALGVETMKMAKIASMDSTEATKAMTAALRGFNMELNETSAVKVNDVYSQLAAVTAADTNQIATAMEKTASIAASANMEFETTAALLAQIIETTQEAPETAGTALKTIIARFAEVKSLRDQGMTTGTDEEGEGIDVNKIQTALRSVGISMEGFFAGTEGLDSILMKLAEKWGTLDFETQRYIATMAAGSRQQSRFIAMMSDYERTAELVSEAQNSAGASQRQFEKTLESMESKLQRLTNAWDQFAMGLTNNEVLKGGVDTLTNLIEGINTLTQGLPGVVKGFTNLGIAIGGLMAGKAVLDMLFGGAVSNGLNTIGNKLGFVSTKKNQQPVTGVPVDQEIGFRQSVKNAGRAVGKKAKGFGRNLTAPFRNENKDIKKSQDRFADFRKKTESDLAGFETDQAKGVRALNKALDEGKITAGEAAESYKELGYDLDKAGINVENLDKKIIENQSSNQQFVQGTQKTAQALGSMSNAMFIAGTACAGLSALLSAMGYDEAAEEVGKLSGIIMGLGAVFMILPPIVKAVGSVVSATGITAQAAWGWISIILLLIAALIFAIVALSNNSKNLEKDLEATNKQIDQMTTASKEAAEALEHITDTREELAEMRNTFRGLVKGTTEWKKALVESNTKVLEMLDLYPELANYVKIAEDGLMEIDTEGWTKIIDIQTEAMVNTQAVSAGLMVKKADILSKLNDDKYYSGDMGTLEYQGQKKQYEIQSDFSLDSYYAAAISSSDLLSNSEYADSAASVHGLGQSAEDFLKEVENEKVNDNKGAEKELVKEYAKLVGKEEQVIQEQLDNGDLTREDIAASLKVKKVTEKAISEMEKMAIKIADIDDEEDRDLVQKILSNNGDRMKYTDLTTLKNELGGDFSVEKVDEYLTGFGIELSDKKLDALVENLNDAFESFTTNFIDVLKGMGFSENSKVTNFMQGIDYGSAQQLIQKIAEMRTEGVDNQQIEQLIMLVKDYAGALGDDALKLLAESNWNSKESIIGVIEHLKSLEGADIEGLNELSEGIIELNKAVSENTSAQLKARAWELADVLEELKTKEIDEDALTTEQKDRLISSGFARAEEFTQIGTDKWQYNGDLYTKVVNLYADTLKNSSEKIGEAEANYAKAKKYSEGDFASRTIDINDLKYAPKRQLTDEELQKVFWGEEDYGLDSKTIGTISSAYQYWNDNDTMKAYYPKFADYLKEYTGEYVTTGEDPEVLNDKAKQINALYVDMAEALNEPYNEDITTEEKLAKINEWNEKWKNTDQYKRELEQARTIGAQSVQTNIDATTSDLGWDIIRNENGSVDVAAQNKYNKERKKALDQRLMSTGGSVFVEEISKSVEEAGGNVKEFDAAIKALASDMAVTTSKVKGLATSMEDLAEDLNPEKRGSIEYGQALGQAKMNVADLFGVGLDDLDKAGISDQFYEALASGNPQALDQIAQLLSGAVLNGVDMANAMALISPTMDQTAIENLYYALGGTEGTFNEDMQGALDFIENRLLLMGQSFAYQINSAGQASAVTSKISFSSLYGRYYGGGKNGGSSNKWTNEYDEFYNMVQKINEELRTREKLELRYQRLINRNAATAKKLAEAVNQQLESYKTERLDRTSLLNARKAQMDSILEQYSDVGKYATYSHESGLIQIDWSALEALEGSTDEKLTSRIEDYISKLEEQKDLIQEEEDALDSIEDGVWEIFDQGKDEYFDFEDRVKEALIEERQREIDKLSEINQSINDTNTKVLESMQSQLEETRQIRDNQKEEKEIADKQRKLAYLQQDTSGANAKEIRELQKEINDAQESYTDKLIDQKISDLQKQNEEAAEQRQQQIDIAQAQLDQWKDSADVWNAVHELIGQSVDIEGNLMEGSKLENLLKEIEGFEGMSTLKKMDWLNTLETTVATSLAWLESGAMQSLYGMGSRVTFTAKNANGENETFSGIVNKYGDVLTDDGRAYAANTFKINAQTGKISSSMSYADALGYRDKTTEITEEAPPVTNVYNTYYSGGGGGPIYSGGNDIEKIYSVAYTPPSGTEAELVIGEGVEYRESAAGVRYYQLKENGNKVNKWISYGDLNSSNSKIDPAKSGSRHNTYDIIGSVKTYAVSEKINKSWYAYKTGGLADFTGPAWLDGTKSKPEYILNADQTKAFFTLVDVLSGLPIGNSKSTQNNGDNTYDIDINVESIGSDYDVERLADTIKRLINENARYRNNNTINLMR